MELAETMGVNFAFPTQTLQMETLPGQTSLSPDYETDPQKMQEKRNSFLGLVSKRFSGKKEG